MKDEDGSLGKDYKDGDNIFEENSIGREMYIVLTGKVKVIKEKDGVETILATWRKESFLGRCHCLTITRVLLP